MGMETTCPKCHTTFRVTTEQLNAHQGDKLATGRALQALANVTTDAQTAKLAKADAEYFFAKY